MPDKLENECDKHDFNMEYDDEECPVCEKIEILEQDYEEDLEQAQEKFDDEVGKLEMEVEDLKEQFPTFESQYDEVKFERLMEVYHLVDETLIRNLEQKL